MNSALLTLILLFAATPISKPRRERLKIHNHVVDFQPGNQTTATFTQLIGGRESKRHSHFSPPSRPIQSWPVVVPT